MDPAGPFATINQGDILMKWIYITLGSLAAIIMVVWVIGMLLPTAHVVSRTAIIPATPENVWKMLTDIPAFPSWRKDLKTVELVDNRTEHVIWKETGSFGAITMERMEADPPRRLVTRIADTNLAYGGRWIYEITPAEGGSRVTITEEGEVYNPLFRFMSRFIFGHSSTIETFLGELGGRFGVVVRSKI